MNKRISTCEGTTCSGTRCQNEVRTIRLGKQHYCQEHSSGEKMCPACGNLIDRSHISCYRHYVKPGAFEDWCVRYFGMRTNLIPQRTNYRTLEEIRNGRRGTPNASVLSLVEIEEACVLDRRGRPTDKGESAKGTCSVGGTTKDRPESSSKVSGAGRPEWKSYTESRGYGSRSPSPTGRATAVPVVRSPSPTGRATESRGYGSSRSPSPTGRATAVPVVRSSSPTTVRATAVSVVRAQSPIDRARAAMASRSSSPPIPRAAGHSPSRGQAGARAKSPPSASAMATKGNTWETPGRSGQTDTPSAPARKSGYAQPDGPVYGRRLEDEWNRPASITGAGRFAVSRPDAYRTRSPPVRR